MSKTSTISSKIVEWAKDLGMPSDLICDSKNLNYVVRGNSVSLWEFLIKNTQNKDKVKLIKDNIEIHNFSQKEDPKTKEMVSERDQLALEMKKLENELETLDKEVTALTNELYDQEHSLENSFETISQSNVKLKFLESFSKKTDTLLLEEFNHSKIEPLLKSYTQNSSSQNSFSRIEKTCSTFQKNLIDSDSTEITVDDSIFKNINDIPIDELFSSINQLALSETQQLEKKTNSFDPDEKNEEYEKLLLEHQSLEKIIQNYQNEHIQRFISTEDKLNKIEEFQEIEKKRKKEIPTISSKYQQLVIDLKTLEVGLSVAEQFAEELRKKKTNFENSAEQVKQISLGIQKLENIIDEKQILIQSLSQKNESLEMSILKEAEKNKTFLKDELNPLLILIPQLRETSLGFLKKELDLFNQICLEKFHLSEDINLSICQLDINRIHQDPFFSEILKQISIPIYTSSDSFLSNLISFLNIQEKYLVQFSDQENLIEQSNRNFENDLKILQNKHQNYKRIEKEEWAPLLSSLKKKIAEGQEESQSIKKNAQNWWEEPAFKLLN